MKIRERFYIYLGIISTSTLLISLSYLFLHLDSNGSGVLPSFTRFPINNFMFFCLFLVVGESLAIFFGNRLFLKLTVDRIQEMNHYLQVMASGKSMRLTEDRYQDELTELRQSIVEVYQNMDVSRDELQNNCRQLAATNQKLESSYIQSYNLQLIQEEISRELEIDKLVKKTADIIMGLFGSERCLIYMADEEDETLTAMAFSGLMEMKALKKSIAFNSDNMVARSWREKAIFTEKDAKPEELTELHKRNINSVLIVPLIGRQGKVGIILLEHELAGGFNDDSIKFARVVAQELSLSVENANLYDKMRQMAIHDALTGAYNRLYLMTYMAEIFASNPKKVSVLIFDMDHFKQINDKFGHLTGDMVLKTTANLILKMLPSGMLARYGGEEFVIVLPEIGQEEAFQFANSIRQMIGHHQFLVSEGKPITVTLSAGVANFPLVSDNYEGLLQHADEAMYEAKNSGRNKVCVATSKTSRTEE